MLLRHSGHFGTDGFKNFTDFVQVGSIGDPDHGPYATHRVPVSMVCDRPLNEL